MKTVRALLIGALVWIFGVSAFTTFYELPLMENQYAQANIGLALLVPLLVWFASQIYYRKVRSTHGLKLGLLMLLASATLDALFTVPILIIPFGGSYTNFFGSLDFWLIACEFLLVSLIYWHIKVRPEQQQSI